MSSSSGTVFLVGAGPGAVDLLTLRAQRAIAAADAVLYDALVNPEMLEIAPPGAERCFVGKRARAHALNQEQIAAWMIARARRGLTVVRLKAGDPLIFARGGEEIAALRAAGVGCEIVPGITAAAAAAASAQVPLTHRGLAPGLRLLTGRAAAADPPAPCADTLAIYMALDCLPELARALLARGWPAATPAFAVARASRSDERVCAASLAALPAHVRRAALPSPALLLLGGGCAVHGAAAPPRSVRTTSRAEAIPGLVLMAHGSSLEGWQAECRRLARSLAAPGQFARAAFLEPVRPSLEEITARAVEAGVRRLAVVPYFLAAGVHVRRDLPRLVEAAKSRFPQCEITLTGCLAGHPALRTAVLARAESAFAHV